MQVVYAVPFELPRFIMRPLQVVMRTCLLAGCAGGFIFSNILFFQMLHNAERNKHGHANSPTHGRSLDIQGRAAHR